MIDWKSEETHWMINPRLSVADRDIAEKVKQQAPQLSSTIWIRSSGTTSVNHTRWVALSKQALLKSAEAVNGHLQSTSKDIWLQVLPDFHVGGLSISARSFLSGAQFHQHLEKWSVDSFYDVLVNKKITLLSLVPTQVYDLVQMELTAPLNLRAVVVGGGALSEPLYAKARQLGWPLLPSYGMTEVGSQIATAELDSLQKTAEPVLPPLRLLEHIEASKNVQGCLQLKSEAIMQGEFVYNAETQIGVWTASDPKVGVVTQDVVDIFGKYLKFLGRISQMVKVNGEQVSLAQLNGHIEKVCFRHQISPQSCLVLDLPHERKGSNLVLVSESKHFNDVEQVVQQFNSEVTAYERLTSIYYVNAIPKTALGKLAFAKVRQLLLEPQ